jgi:hypothetical protein
MATLAQESLMSFLAARYCSFFALCCLNVCLTVAHAEPVTLERDSVLRAEPRTDSATVTTLPNGATGEALARQGAWVQIRSGSATGWLYSFNVRFGAAPSLGDGAGSVLGRVFGSRQRVNVTSTIGIRGLDEEDLKQARFDSSQVQQLDNFAASRDQAESHAGGLGLSAAKIDYLGGSSGAASGSSTGNRE